MFHRMSLPTCGGAVRLQGRCHAGYGHRLGERAAYTAKVLTDAILAAEKDKNPLQLQFRHRDQYTTIAIPYYEGMRYPSLQRVTARRIGSMKFLRRARARCRRCNTSPQEGGCCRHLTPHCGGLALKAVCWSFSIPVRLRYSEICCNIRRCSQRLALYQGTTFSRVPMSCGSPEVMKTKVRWFSTVP